MLFLSPLNIGELPFDKTPATNIGSMILQDICKDMMILHEYFTVTIIIAQMYVFKATILLLDTD
jgi:hypothetical protein